MDKNKLVNQAELIQDFFGEDTEPFFDKVTQFNQLMMKYNSAIREVKTKLEILNDELSFKGEENPIESIQSRIKKPMSIAKKLRKLGKPITVESVEENLSDVAGIRVICPFIEDIYQVAEMLIAQDDIVVIEIKDYITAPKPNGYRSYHMIIEVPVFFSKYKQPMRVEVQIRTVAMDFWASLEHQLKYKNENTKTTQIAQELKECADVIANTDLRMQNLRHKINDKPVEKP